MLSFEFGLAVSEMKQSKMEVLYERMVEQYKLRLEAIDPVSDDNLHDNFTGKSYFFSVRDNLVETFKKSIEDNDGNKMWNHWLTHFKIQSGKDDVIERVKMYAWAYHAIRNVKKNNMKAELEGREPDKEKVSSDAPPGSNTNILYEIPVVKKHHDHPFPTVNLRASEDNSGEDSEKEDNGDFRSIVASMKSRKKQRKEQQELDRKKGLNKGGDERTRHFDMQAATANC